MAKKIESNKATALNTLNSMHQPYKVLPKINILWHNCTSLSPKKKIGGKKPNPSKGTKPQQPQQQKWSNQHQPCERSPNQCTRYGDSPRAQGFNCLAIEVPRQTLHKNWTLHQNVLYQKCTPTATALS